MSDTDTPAMMVGSIAQLNDTPGESPAIGFMLKYGGGDNLMWQPIETAPKDGTWVLLSDGVVDDQWLDASVPPGVVARWVENKSTGGYWAFAHWDSDWRSEYVDPYFWMPFPGA